MLILERIDEGRWTHLSSEMAVIEINVIPDVERQTLVRLLLPEPRKRRQLNLDTFQRAQELEKLGFQPADAVHLAAAERYKGLRFAKL